MKSPWRAARIATLLAAACLGCSCRARSRSTPGAPGRSRRTRRGGTRPASISRWHFSVTAPWGSSAPSRTARPTALGSRYGKSACREVAPRAGARPECRAAQARRGTSFGTADAWVPRDNDGEEDAEAARKGASIVLDMNLIGDLGQIPCFVAIFGPSLVSRSGACSSRTSSADGCVTSFPGSSAEGVTGWRRRTWNWPQRS